MTDPPDDTSCEHTPTHRVSTHSDIAAAARAGLPHASAYSCNRRSCLDRVEAWVRAQVGWDDSALLVVVPLGPGEGETDGGFLARVGTDAVKWAHAFLTLNDVTPRLADEDAEHDDTGLMVAWFANAIEAGRTAGYGAAKREQDPSWPASEVTQ